MLLRHSMSRWIYIGLGVSALLACSSKTTVTPTEPQTDSHWYCTPQSDDEWLCQESDDEFVRLARQRQTMVEEPDQTTQTEPQLTATEPVTPSSPIIQTPTESQSLVEDEPSQLTEPTQSKPVVPADKGQSESQDLDTESEVSAWVVQLAAYTREDGAIRLSNQVPDSRYYQTLVNGQTYYTVVLSGFATQSEAHAAAQRLQTQNLGVIPWVRRGEALRQVMVP
ncbi:SPOR domain-containing protein [Kangiella shandongensis]|uniref:SPOR domain-containing protein n=1 Tax=Kangiella shandongensis TaxID=2763258 RepID=UPI001CC12FBC|nr:SPOR domain-containing protein [Kangiella shandongensis]